LTPPGLVDRLQPLLLRLPPLPRRTLPAREGPQITRGRTALLPLLVPLCVHPFRRRKSPLLCGAACWLIPAPPLLPSPGRGELPRMRQGQAQEQAAGRGCADGAHGTALAQARAALLPQRTSATTTAAAALRMKQTLQLERIVMEARETRSRATARPRSAGWVRPWLSLLHPSG
jgi:hypothetical protein